jgi:hypothetical protein
MHLYKLKDLNKYVGTQNLKPLSSYEMQKWEESVYQNYAVSIPAPFQGQESIA